MCGIFGFQGPFAPELLTAANQMMAYRGPDDSGMYYDAESMTGLAHRRLSIIDLSPLGKQPMWDVSGTAAITFNGEIYNYRELREELLSQGYRFQSATDTEVLLNLYLRYNTNMLEHLNGMFAFAIFDTRDRSLFVARDGVGVKPLYVSELPKGFLFSSELKALLIEQAVPRTVCPAALHAYVTYLWCPAPLTMLEAVKKVEPGYALRVKHGRVVAKWRFYELPYGENPDGYDETRVVDEFRRTFQNAVQRQMISDAPVGAFLSGGLDSSSVVAVARRYHPNNSLKCYNIAVKGITAEGFDDDAVFAKRVAQRLGVELHCLEADAVRPTDIPGMIYHLDEPQADPAALLVRHISKLAKSHGVKVLLSGTGGDDMLCGYRRHQAVMLERFWSWLPRGLRRMARVVSGRLPTSSVLFRRIRKAFEYADASENERIVGYLMWLPQFWALRIYGERMRAALATPGFGVNGMLRALDGLPSRAAPIDKLLFLDAKHFLTDHNLNYTDKMSMAEGIEVRVPFLDRELIRFAARLPMRWKQRGLTGKRILREAMKGELPQETMHRSKTGFVVPVRSWFREKLPETFAECLSESVLRRRGWFDGKGVSALIDATKRGKVDGAYPLLAMVCIEIWLRSFVDPPVPQRLS